MNLTDEKTLTYLSYMQQAIEDILEYTQNVTFDEFVADKAKRQATQLNLIILGENAGRLLTQKTHLDDSEQIFKLAKQMRNFISHQYESVDLTLIYATATQDIPMLQLALNRLITLIQSNNNHQIK